MADPTIGLRFQSPTTSSPDTLFDGKLICAQSRSGYRFSIDAVLLAHFVTPRRHDRILDLGAGCGVISLILASRYPDVTLTCLEIQESLVQLIHYNIHENTLGDRLQVVTGDLCSITGLVPAGEHDLVVCNPPYYRADTGRQNLNQEQAVARHEIKARLDDVVQAAAFAIKTKGRLAMIYPASRITSLLSTLKHNRLEPKRLRVVYSYPGVDATLCLVEAVKCGGDELVLLPPLYIYDQPGGDYTPEVEAWYHLETSNPSSVNLSAASL
ncbi:MAG: tRNA1(Val) (adenine(37)-N6)-methyltransferase [Proteobacteria bacterium]|nr:tRNA1(Val) (adenine(37)-N6)-methyltransferase [Pseudomonadota bacterium]MDP2104541.1 tRNA1(Val) (adenine(37)-N6)-methyltransferase [Desulfobulbaceae bacterium]